MPLPLYAKNYIWAILVMVCGGVVVTHNYKQDFPETLVESQVAVSTYYPETNITLVNNATQYQDYVESLPTTRVAKTIVHLLTFGRKKLVLSSIFYTAKQLSSAKNNSTIVVRADKNEWFDAMRVHVDITNCNDFMQYAPHLGCSVDGIVSFADSYALLLVGNDTTDLYNNWHGGVGGNPLEIAWWCLSWYLVLPATIALWILTCLLQ